MFLFAGILSNRFMRSDELAALANTVDDQGAAAIVSPPVTTMTMTALCCTAVQPHCHQPDWDGMLEQQASARVGAG